MYCKNCGNELSDDAKFCRKCGAKTEPDSSEKAAITGQDENRSEGEPASARKAEDMKQPVGTGKVKKGGGMKIAGIFFLTFFILLAIFIGFVYFLIKHYGSEGRTGSDTVETDAIEALDIPFEISEGGMPENTIPEDILEKMGTQAAERLNEMKKEDSDIEGWTVYDKYEYGLHIENGSDTDGDGLTDKEEIEVYGSDPLKESTADDLYTDGYKAENGMDLFAYAAYDGPDELVNDEGTITLKVNTPSDLSASIIDRTEDFRDEDAKILEGAPEQYYYAYQICNYLGDNITVELKPYADKLGMDAGYLDVEFVSFDGCGYNIERTEDVMTITLSDENKHYSNDMDFMYVFIKNITSLNCSGFSILSDNITGFSKPMFGKASNKCPYLLLYCSEDTSEEERDALLCSGEIMWYHNTGEIVRLDETDVNIMSYKDFQFICYYFYYGMNYQKEFRTIATMLGSDYNGAPLPFRELPYGYVESDYLWFSEDYLNNDYLRNYMEETRGIKKPELARKKSNTNFGFEDEFSFENFSVTETNSNKDYNGFCAGMAQIAAEVYNYGSVQLPQDTVTFPGTGTVGYDITGYSELNTFLDKKIADYPLNLAELSDADQEFITMLACYWRRTNDQIPFEDMVDKMLLESRGNLYLSWETVENAMKYLDDDKILLCALNIDNIWGRGHMINLVSYRRSNLVRADGDKYETVIFDVYDSNYPQRFMKLECIKNGDVMYYRYNTGKEYLGGEVVPGGSGEKANEYCSYFLGNDYSLELADDNKGIKADSPCVLFGIFNDKGECLNVRY